MHKSNVSFCDIFHQLWCDCTGMTEMGGVLLGGGLMASPHACKILSPSVCTYQTAKKDHLITSVLKAKWRRIMLIVAQTFSQTCVACFFVFSPQYKGMYLSPVSDLSPSHASLPLPAVIATVCVHIYEQCWTCAFTH